MLFAVLKLDRTFLSSGYIDVIDSASEDWKLLLRWQAHKSAILRLFLDTKSLWSGRSVRVVSSGNDQQICFWVSFS